MDIDRNPFHLESMKALWILINRAYRTSSKGIIRACSADSAIPLLWDGRRIGNHPQRIIETSNHRDIESSRLTNGEGKRSALAYPRSSINPRSSIINQSSILDQLPEEKGIACKPVNIGQNLC